MPAPELVLWSKLRNGQLSGYRFRRQHSIGRYVVDFYCAAKKVAIELDGHSHFTSEAVKYDTVRDQFLESCGVSVIRYTNDDVMKNLGGVLEDLLKRLVAAPTPSAPDGATPPQAGGENDYYP